LTGELILKPKKKEIKKPSRSMDKNTDKFSLETLFRPNQKASELYNATCNSFDIHPEIKEVVQFQNELQDLLHQIVSGELDKDVYEKINTLLANPNVLEEKIQRLKLKTELDESIYQKYHELLETDILQPEEAPEANTDDTVLYNITKEKVKKAQGMVNRRENIQANITKVTNEMISKKELVPNTLDNLTHSKEEYLNTNAKMEAIIAKKESQYNEQFQRIEKLRQLLKDVDSTMNITAVEDVEMD